MCTGIDTHTQTPDQTMNAFAQKAPHGLFTCALLPIVVVPTSICNILQLQRKCANGAGVGEFSKWLKGEIILPLFEKISEFLANICFLYGLGTKAPGLICSKTIGLISI